MNPGLTQLVVLMAILLPLPALAQGDFPEPGVYTIDKFTEANHEGSRLMVFQNQSDKSKPIVLFMTVKGDWPFQPFVCDRTFGQKATKSVACAKLNDKGSALKLEKLEVGLLDGDFCKQLAAKHNSPQKTIIPNACSRGKQCVCYDLSHELLAGVESDNAGTTDQGGEPPEAGAGSGGSGGGA